MTHLSKTLQMNGTEICTTDTEHTQRPFVRIWKPQERLS